MTKSFIEVETMADRSNIPPANKSDGLICHVKENDTYWEWNSSSWVDLTPKTGDLDDIRNAIITLEANKANKSELQSKSDVGHKHTEYALADHNHTGLEGTLISREEFSKHIDNLDADGNPSNAIHLTKVEKESAFAIASDKDLGRIKVGQSLFIKEDGTLDVRADAYEIGEDMTIISEADVSNNRTLFYTDSPYIQTTLQVFLNGSRISDQMVIEGEVDDSGRKTGFTLTNVKLRIGDRLIATYFKGAALALGAHGHTHIANGEDPIPFASQGNGGGLISWQKWDQIEKNRVEIEKKLNISETTKTATPNKILYLDKDGELPASIKGNATSATKLQTARRIGGGRNGDNVNVDGALFDGTANIDADQMNVAHKVHKHKSSDTTAMTGYTKGNTSSQVAISTTDSLNVAIGKLEKALDFKTNSGHNHQSSDVVGMNGYNKASVNLTTNKVTPTDTNFTVAMTRENIATTDSLNTAVAKLDVAADLNRQMAEHALRLGKLYTDDRFKTLLDGVDLDFDTLKELAAAIGNDKDFHKTVQAKLDLKANIESPTLTGVPKAPTPATSTNSTQIATTAFVHSVGQAKVDTHKVVVATDAQLGHIKSGGDITVNSSGVVAVNDNSHNHLWANITDRPKKTSAEIEDAVNKRHSHDNKAILDGTQQSFTTALKNKLDNIETNANKYVLPVATETSLGGIKVGEGLTINTTSGILSITDLPGDRTYVVTKEEEFVATENQTVFMLSDGFYMRGCGQIEAFINGSKVPLKSIVEYIECDRVGLPTGLSAGDRVLIRYTQLSRIIGQSHFNTHLPGGLDEIPSASPTSSGLMSKEDKVKLNSLAVNSTSVASSTTNGNIKINGTETAVYRHPDTASIRHVTDTEKSTWNAKETPSGAQTKADKALNDAKAYAEPKFTKNTGFNKNLGTAAGTVAEGNHNHNSAYLGINAKAVDSDKVDGYHVDDAKTGADATTNNAIWTANKVKTELDKKSNNHNHPYRPDTWVPTWDNITGKPATFAPSAHNQASSTINAMTGYAKASAASAVAATDSLNTAIGKIEKALDGKSATHNHPYAPDTHPSVVATGSVLGHIKSGGDITIASTGIVSVNDNSHAHTIANVTGLQTALDGKAPTHNHPYEPANANIQAHISSAHLSLGETSSTAYRGDYGKIAYTHSQSAHAPSNAQKNSDITKAEIEAKLTGAITTHTHAYRPNTWVPSWSDVASKPSTFAPTIGTTSTTAAAGNHNHDSVYLKKSDSHTHTNKALLDGISAERMESWDKGGSGGSGILVSATPPTSPTLNMLWVDLN